MNVTVAICTWNRCGLLERTLEQMTRLVIPDDVSWELLVVNNNCTDGTDAVIASFTGRLPIRALAEPRPGQTHARNRAIREAKGEYILWTDDDVLVDRDWIAAYVRAFRRWPDATVLGGPIEPWFEGSPPAWLAAAFSHVAGAYAVLDLGSEPMRLHHNAYPYGANMAFRTDVQRRFPFDPELGLRPGSTARGDEMTLARELFAAGEEGRWVPEARVRHFIPRDRQTLRYLRGYYYGAGQVLAAAGAGDARGAASFLGRPLWLWRQAVTNEALYHVRRLFAPPHAWVQNLTWASVSWGQLSGSRPRATNGSRLPADAAAPSRRPRPE